MWFTCADIFAFGMAVGGLLVLGVFTFFAKRNKKKEE